MVRNGKSTADDKLIELQKDTIAQQDRTIKDQQSRADELLRQQNEKADAQSKELSDKISTLSDKSDQQAKELAHLHGMVEEKDKKAQEYLDILKDRDPASQKVVEMAIKYMSDTGAILADIHAFITAQKALTSQSSKNTLSI